MLWMDSSHYGSANALHCDLILMEDSLLMILFVRIQRESVFYEKTRSKFREITGKTRSQNGTILPVVYNMITNF